MTVAGEVLIHVGDDGTTVKLDRVLASLESRMQQTDAAGTRLGQATGGVLASAQSRAAASTGQLVDALRQANIAAGGDETRFLSLAGAMSQEALATGDAARAEQILAVAMGNQGLAAIEGAAATRQATTEQQKLGASARASADAAQKIGAAFRQNLLSIVGPAAIATGALALLRSAVNQAEEGFKLAASLEQQQRSITILSRGIRDSAADFDAAAAFGRRYMLTQEDVTDAMAESIPVARNSRASMDEILSVFTRLTILKPGKTFQDAARAIAELQSGQVTSINKVFNIPLAQAHKMKEEIDGGADAIQVLSRYLTNAGVGMEALESRTKGATGKMNELRVESEKASLAMGGAGGGPGLAILEGRITAARATTRLFSGDITAMGQSLVQEAQRGTLAFQTLQGVFPGFGAAIQGLAIDTGVLEAETQRLGSTNQQVAQTSIVATGVVLQNAQAQAEATAFARQHTQALTDDRAEAVQWQQQYIGANAALRDSTIAGQADAQSKQALTAQTQLLEAQNIAAANAFLALNPTIDASGVAALAAAGKIDPLLAQLIQATLRAREATAALAAFNTLQGLKNQTARQLIGAQGNEAEVRGFQRSASRDLRDQRVSDAQAAAAAERAYQVELKNFGPAIARARAELAQLPEGSEAAWNKMTQIEQLKQAQAAALRKKGGAAKQSDQTKLNNTLLNDQQRANDQELALEKAHNQKLLDIDRQFQKKSLEQMKANELSKRATEIDFLKQLTSSELNNSREGKAELARIDAKYYADFAAAQKAAQEGNLKQSEEMAAAARHRADVEIQYAEQIDQARRNKNKSEIARLEALREKERQLLDEQEKQIQEGGDPNVKARQDALDDEERNFREQQGKIIDSSNAAAERKIDNAIRSKKKVDEENLSYKEQEDTINRISAARGGPPTPGTAPANGTVPLTIPTSTGAPVDLAALLGALTAVQTKLDEVGGIVKGAIEADTRQTTAAIGRLQGTRFAQ